MFFSIFQLKTTEEGHQKIYRYPLILTLEFCKFRTGNFTLIIHYIILHNHHIHHTISFIFQNDRRPGITEMPIALEDRNSMDAFQTSISFQDMMDFTYFFDNSENGNQCKLLMNTKVDHNVENWMEKMSYCHL